MKKEDIPQDKGPLSRYTDEVVYIKNKDGHYETALSSGWKVKNEALDNAWDDIKDRVKFAKDEVLAGRKSPIFYFMEKKLMDYNILAAYVNIWKFKVKRHMKPAVFSRLSKKTIERYAKVFEIDSEELINFKGE